MNKSVIFFVCLTLVSSCVTVKEHFAQTPPAKAYLCIGNTISKKNISTKKNVLLSTFNGSVKKSEYRAGFYDLFPAHPGNAIIYVCKRRTHRVFDSIAFEVVRFPLNAPDFAGENGGILSQDAVIAQTSLVAAIECCDFDAFWKVKGYSIQVQRENKRVFDRDVVGHKIDSLSREFFYKLEDKDSLQFTNIVVEDCDGQCRNLPSIAFLIVNAHKYKDVEKNNLEYIDPTTGETLYRAHAIVKERID